MKLIPESIIYFAYLQQLAAILKTTINLVEKNTAREIDVKAIKYQSPNQVYIKFPEMARVGI